MSPTRLSCFIVAAIASCAVANVSAESLPQMRPAMIGSGPGSLVNLIDTEALFRKVQRNAWVMFDCGVAGDGLAFGSDFFTFSPNAKLLEKAPFGSELNIDTANQVGIPTTQWTRHDGILSGFQSPCQGDDLDLSIVIKL